MADFPHFSGDSTDSCAEYFLDLWQQQLSLTLIQNPETINLLIDMLTAFLPGNTPNPAPPDTHR